MNFDERPGLALQLIIQPPPADRVHLEGNVVPLRPGDPRQPTHDEDTMTTPTREEIDAKLETISVRMDGRVASIEAKIDGFTARLDEKFGRMDDRMTRIEASTAETESSIKNLKSTVILTAISTVLAIVLGVAAFNATVLSNMVASFESGKNTAAAQAEVKRQSEETAALLKQIQQDINTNKK